MPSSKQTQKISASKTKRSRITSKPSLSNASQPSPKAKTKDVFNVPSLAKGKPRARVDEIGEDDTPVTLRAYEERYVAFIDILGFKELVRRSVDERSTFASLDAIYNAMDLKFAGVERDYAQQFGLAPDAHDLRVNTFSDFVVISCAGTAQGLDALCFVVWCVARDWLSKGYLSRGGIAKGKVIHLGGTQDRPGLVFGPAFLDAYQLETEVADFPRVVLSKEVRKDVKRYRTAGATTKLAIDKLLATCSDGPMCIDVFAHLKNDGFSFLGLDQRPEAKQFAETLFAQLDHGADVPRWHRKTKWLIDKFNSAIVRTTYADLAIRDEAI